MSTEENHPSFGVATIHLADGNGQNLTALFDTSLRHSRAVILRIATATRHRELSRDWIYPRKTVVEVRMTPAQWGALTAAFGSGGGVPVTIAQIGEEIIEPPPFDSRLEVTAKEVTEATEQQLQEVEKATAALRNAFDSNLGRRELRGALQSLEGAVSRLPSNLRFTIGALDRHARKVVEDAKWAARQVEEG